METEIKTTTLNSRHRDLGATMVEFGGFDMPIEYAAGIVGEHNAVRNAVGVFDVSHMGEVLVTGPQAQKFVNRLFTNDVTAIEDGAILYGMMLNERGGVVDDLLVYRRSHDEYLLVINAANIDKDVAWIEKQAAAFDVKVDNQSGAWSELAVQGPLAAATVKDVLGLDQDDLVFYHFRDLTLPGGEPAIVSRTGYTGEDGFEIYAPHGAIQAMWDKLIAAGVQPCGLGCRDTLRFEAGLPLYGDELTDDTTPVEAALSMFCKPDKEGAFIGSQTVVEQKTNGAPRKTVGLEINAPAIARHGYEVLDPADGHTVGYITTGYRSITLDRNIAMAIVETPYSKLGTELQVKVRRKTFPATVVKKRFYTPNYKK